MTMKESLSAPCRLSNEAFAEQRQVMAWWRRGGGMAVDQQTGEVSVAALQESIPRWFAGSIGPADCSGKGLSGAAWYLPDVGRRACTRVSFPCAVLVAVPVRCRIQV